MNVSDSDLDLLETYLDGELPVGDAEDLWRRLRTEPMLSAALDELRAERSDRQMVWNSLEPSDATVAKVGQRLKSAGRRHDLMNFGLRGLQYGAAIAACLMFAIAGWTSRGRLMQQEPQPLAMPTPAKGDPGTEAGIMPASMDLVPGSEQPQRQLVFPSRQKGPLLVRMDDGNGHSAIQPFNSEDEFNRFVADVKRLQAEQVKQQVPVGAPAPSPVVPVNYEYERF
jgi:hypothetical protein